MIMAAPPNRDRYSVQTYVYQNVVRDADQLHGNNDGKMSRQELAQYQNALQQRAAVAGANVWGTGPYQQEQWAARNLSQYFNRFANILTYDNQISAQEVSRVANTDYNSRTVSRQDLTSWTPTPIPPMPAPPTPTPIPTPTPAPTPLPPPPPPQQDWQQLIQQLITLITQLIAQMAKYYP